jgi:hypothetical protein
MATRRATEIAQRVVHNLSVLSGIPESQITETDRLAQDLRISKEGKRALAPGFEAIARETNPGASITRVECEKLLTVKAAVALVTSRATASPAAA